MKRSFRSTQLAIATVLAALLCVAAATAQTATPAKKAPAPSRVDALLKQMTLDEKITLVHGTGEPADTDQGQAGYLAGIPRLGIPALRLADGPPGVLTRVPSTALTATMGLAATFSREDAKANGMVIAREAKAHGIDVVLQPFINIDRDLAYGRGYNTYGEDPFLSGQIAASFIRGVQGLGVMSQAKHYVGYDTDGTNVFVDKQTLHEIYVAPFADAVEAGVSSIMCSYNKVNGPYSCGNSDTLKTILKKELKFQGFVTSDWGATHATDFINQGLDMEMSGPLPVPWSIPSYFVNGTPVGTWPPDPDDGHDALSGGLPEEPASAPWENSNEPTPTTNLKTMLKDGTLTEATITAAARRVLVQMDKFGFLDGKPRHNVTASPVELNAKVIQKTSEDAAVLLKNEHHILPLKASDLHSVAMIGPGAGQVVAIGLTGEKAVGLTARQVGPVDAVKKLAGPGASITYAAANDLTGTPIPAALFTHEGKPGLERIVNGAATQTDAQVNFTKSNGNALPANTTMRWKGTLNIPEAGAYRINLQLLGCFSNLMIDGKRVARVGINWIHGNITQAAQDDIAPTTDGLDNVRLEMHLTAGPHAVEVSIKPDTSNDPAQVRLNWVTPQQQKNNYDAAIAAAKSAKVAVVFAWSRTRPVFGLPGDQDKLIADIAAVNPNTVVVLNVSQPVAMPWLDKVKGVLQMWWSGDEGGWATANILLGKRNPAGRLPFTWAKQLTDMSASDPKFPERSNKGVDGKTTFSEGIFVGYRWFDKQKIEPLFPFGFGLSYARFDYSALQVATAADGGLDATFTIKNSGNFAGDEVPQLYLGAPAQPPQDGQFAPKALASFDRITLAPGDSKTVTLHVRPKQLQYFSIPADAWITAKGPRKVYVGGSSRDEKLVADVNITK